MLSSAIGSGPSPGENLMNWLSFASDLSGAGKRVSCRNELLASGKFAIDTIFQSPHAGSPPLSYQSFPKFIKEPRSAAAALSANCAGDAGRGFFPSSFDGAIKTKRENV